MRCPVCETDDTRVIDSRPTDKGDAIRRRRQCRACSYRFTTYERTVPTMVRKRDGRLEPFDADKVRRGLVSALADRPAAPDTVDVLVGRCEELARRSAGEVTADDIGRTVLDGLREVDEVAYLRFASVYKEFQEAQDFEREMAALEDQG